MGEIIKSIPSTEDLEAENFEFEIKLVYLTHKTKEEIENVLGEISEIDSIIIEKIDSNDLKISNENKKEEVKQEKKETPAVKKENVKSQAKPKPAEKSTEGAHKKFINL